MLLFQPAASTFTPPAAVSIPNVPPFTDSSVNPDSNPTCSTTPEALDFHSDCEMDSDSDSEDVSSGSLH